MLKSKRFQDSIRQEIKIKLKPDWDTHKGKGKGKGALLADLCMLNGIPQNANYN